MEQPHLIVVEQSMILDYSNLAVSGKVRRLVARAHEAYSVCMSKRLFNWTYRDVINFLEEKGYEFYEDLGHAKTWVKLRRGEPDMFVEIKFTQGFYSSKALDKMVCQSGVGADEWIKWAFS